MDDMNKAILYGNIGKDPEFKHTNNGQGVLKFSLATTDFFRDSNDQKKERTDWHNISVWGKRGEALANILRKGMRVLIQGSIRTTTYEKNGEKKYFTEVNADDIEFGTKGDNPDSGPPKDRKEFLPLDLSPEESLSPTKPLVEDDFPF